MKNPNKRLNEILDGITAQLNEIFGENASFMLYLADTASKNYTIAHTAMFKHDFRAIRNYANLVLSPPKPVEPHAKSDD